jgi:hypothetical protein
MNAPVEIVEGKQAVSTALLKSVGVVIRDIRRDLQGQIDALREAHKKRSIDIYEEMAAMKNQLASVASDKTAAVREVVTLRREIASLRGEVDALRRPRHG